MKLSVCSLKHRDNNWCGRHCQCCVFLDCCRRLQSFLSALMIFHVSSSRNEDDFLSWDVMTGVQKNNQVTVFCPQVRADCGGTRAILRPQSHSFCLLSEGLCDVSQKHFSWLFPFYHALKQEFAPQGLQEGSAHRCCFSPLRSLKALLSLRQHQLILGALIPL